MTVLSMSRKRSSIPQRVCYVERLADALNCSDVFSREGTALHDDESVFIHDRIEAVQYFRMLVLAQQHIHVVNPAQMHFSLSRPKTTGRDDTNMVSQQ